MLLKQQSVCTTPQTKPTGQNTSQEGSINKPPGQSQSDEGSLLSLVSSYAVDCTVAASEKVKCVYSCQKQLCTRICVCAMIGLLKKAIVDLPIRLKKKIETLFWLFSETIGGQEQRYLTIRELDYVCTSGSATRQFLNDINNDACTCNHNAPFFS